MPGLTFDLYAWRFTFVARESLHFPSGKSGNILRGAFGTIFRKMDSGGAYTRIFEPGSTGEGPSGVSDWPRPFVFRSSHLDGRTITDGQPFYFDLHVFELRDNVLPYFVETFAQLAHEGLGPQRGRADLIDIWQLDAAHTPAVRVFQQPSAPLSFSLLASAEPVSHIAVRFLTPTELKSGQQLARRPEFPILFARTRDRLSTLRALYGAGPLDIEFRAMGEHAQQVRMTRCDLKQTSESRRSSRTRQTHPLGGFTGVAEYEGELAEFIGYLKAAEWTGVGRQTVWGKGEIATEVNEKVRIGAL